MTKNRSHSLLALVLIVALAAEAQDAEQSVPVAEEDVQPAADESAPTEEQLLEEFARYRRLYDEGILDEADIAAKRIVEMAIKIYGPLSRETANALNNLGIVQHGNGQFDPAIQNFTSAIEIIEAVEDRLNEALVNPLKGLGAAQLGNGRPDQAVETYTRATHITHVNEGPHNLQQVEILEATAEALIRAGDTKAARQVLDRIHIVNVKHFEKNPLGLLPSLMNRANWQHRAGYYADERASYRRAIRIIESSGGSNDPLLVEPLRRLGESYYYVAVSNSLQANQSMITSGEVFLKRALRIAEKDKDFDWKDMATTQVALADYLVNAESSKRAHNIYLDVWQNLSTDETRLAVRDEWFRDPVAIRAISLPQFASGTPSRGSPSNPLLVGEIVIEYSITDRGELRELRSIVTPAEFSDLQRVIHREMRQRVFRPRIVDGVPVASDNVQFVHNFSYLQSELDTLKAANPAPEEEPDEELPDDEQEPDNDAE